LEEHVFYYLNDIVIIIQSFKQYEKLVAEILRRLWEAKLKPNWRKGQYLRYRVTEEEIGIDPETAIVVITPLYGTKDLRRINEMISWYWCFVLIVVTLIGPLNELLHKYTKYQEVYEKIRQCLKETPILAYQNFKVPFILQTDASNEGFGVVLLRHQKGEKRIIAYASRSLNKSE
jgi:hypothetical protein